MNSIPSHARSNRLYDTMIRFNLLDPYRHLSPNLTDFSYQPYGTVRNNRSRIDFFLVSQELAGKIRKATILNNFSKKSFDHRPVFLQLGKQKSRGRAVVNRDVNDNTSSSIVKLRYRIVSITKRNENCQN